MFTRDSIEQWQDNDKYEQSPVELAVADLYDHVAFTGVSTFNQVLEMRRWKFEPTRMIQNLRRLSKFWGTQVFPAGGHTGEINVLDYSECVGPIHAQQFAHF